MAPYQVLLHESNSFHIIVLRFNLINGFHNRKRPSLASTAAQSRGKLKQVVELGGEREQMLA